MIKVETALAEYKDFMLGEHKSKSHVKEVIDVLTAFFESIKLKDVDKINLDTFDEFRTWLKKNGYSRVLKGYMNYLPDFIRFVYIR